MTVLVRGLPETIHRKIQRIARSKNLSTNQVFVEAVVFYLKKKAEEEIQERERKQVFQRIRDHRQRMYLKYGLSSDSTKMIREDRDSR